MSTGGGPLFVWFGSAGASLVHVVVATTFGVAPLSICDGRSTPSWVSRSSRLLVAAKQTPFHDVGIEAGAEMQELFGYWLPWQYERGHVEEHLATRNRVSICDLDYMAEFKIVGPAALQFAQELLTNDFSNLAIGRVRYTAMCNLDGNMVDDGTLWRLADNEYLLITGSESDFDWVSSQASGFDVEVSNITSTWTTLAVQGPESRPVIEALVGPGVVDSLPYYGFVRASVDRL
jgi:aminomethyltransferase